MLQTVKSSFLILVIFTMSSAVYAADNNGGTKQPETIIHKAGIEVKSTRIYDGVPSQQEMETQGKSLEEIKGPDMSAQETTACDALLTYLALYPRPHSSKSEMVALASI